jgi:hypothetical protein
MRSLALAALLAVSPLTPAHSGEIAGSQFAAGNWYGSGYTDDRGAFSYCWVAVDYIGGETIWIGLYADDTLAVLMSHPNMRYTPGQTFDSWLMLETGLPTRGVSEAWNASFAGMTLQGIDASIDFRSAGRWLRLLGVGIDEAYDVTGIKDALASARVCHARNSGSNPFATVAPAPVIATAPEPEPVPTPEPTPEPALGSPPPMPKVPDLTPKPGGGLGTRPGGALGTPAPKPTP